MKIQRLAAVTMVLAACLVGAGCQGAGGGGGGGSTGADNAGGGSAKKVPQDARRVAEATGSRLIHRPLREGTIYVTEVQPGTGERRETVKVLHSGPIRAGANVVIDPAANAVTVNDQQVKSAPKLEQGKTYRLYFLQK